MPARFVPNRVEDYIFYYYAKLVIAPAAGFTSNYRFVVDAYKKLKAGRLHISDYDRELVQIAQTANFCAYCGKETTAAIPSEIVPRSLGGPVGIHNLVMACPACHKSKDEHDLVEWWRNVLKRDLDSLPRVPLGLYLKQAYEAHKINFSLNSECTDLRQIFRILRSDGNTT